jgi:hypothetical protein
MRGHGLKPSLAARQLLDLIFRPELCDEEMRKEPGLGDECPNVLPLVKKL